MRKIRVLHTPTVTGGNPPMLAKAERRVGLDSWAVMLGSRPGTNPFGYGVDESLWPNGYEFPYSEITRWGLLAKARRDFDVIHFNFGQSIMPSRVFHTKYSRVYFTPNIVEFRGHCSICTRCYLNSET
jgi:hypothetical protein